MNTLILVKVKALYENCPIPGSEDDDGNEQFGTWVETRRDWFIEDREGIFPDGPWCKNATFEKEQWDYDTRQGFCIKWKKDKSDEIMYRVITQLLECMEKANYYEVYVTAIPVSEDLELVPAIYERLAQ